MTPDALKPVLWEVEPIGVDGAMEANGQTHRFCSEQCRRVYELDAEVRAGYEPSTEWPEGAVCDECGKPLEAPHATD